MKIEFLGTGGAFDVDYGNSAALLQVNQHTILLDCGFTVYTALRQKQRLEQIDSILLTHLHNDHSGSLANLLLHFQFFIPEKRPVLLYPEEKFRKELLEFLRMQIKNPEKYADFKLLQDVLPQAGFIDTLNKHSENMQSYAYYFEDDEERLVYSGDLAEPEALFEVLEKLPPKQQRVFHDITFNPQKTGHTYYKKLLPYHTAYNILGYHCNPQNKKPDCPVPLVYEHQELLA